MTDCENGGPCDKGEPCPLGAPVLERGVQRLPEAAADAAPPIKQRLAASWRTSCRHRHADGTQCAFVGDESGYCLIHGGGGGRK